MNSLGLKLPTVYLLSVLLLSKLDLLSTSFMKSTRLHTMIWSQTTFSCLRKRQKNRTTSFSSQTSGTLIELFSIVIVRHLDSSQENLLSSCLQKWFISLRILNRRNHMIAEKVTSMLLGSLSLISSLEISFILKIQMIWGE